MNNIEPDFDRNQPPRDSDVMFKMGTPPVAREDVWQVKRDPFDIGLDNDAPF